MRWLLLLVLLPLATAYVAIYAPNFDPNCYYYEGDDGTYIQADGAAPLLLRDALRAMGIDAEVASVLDPNADAVIVLSCSDVNVKELESYILNGGNVIVDTFSIDLPEIGIFRSSQFRGIVLADYEPAIPYVSIRGFLVADPAVGGPVTDRARMYYVGPTIEDKNGFLNTGFLNESVLYWGTIGKGRVVATGCLLCADPSFLADMVDWAVDGVLDFPSVSVKREYPTEVAEGDQFQEVLRISVPRDIEVSVDYPTDPKYCGGPTRFEEENYSSGGNAVVVAKIAHNATIPCQLPPVTITARWRGELREIHLPPVSVSVVPAGFPSISDAERYLPFLLVLLLILIAASYPRWKVWRIRARIRRLERALKIIEYKYRTNQISKQVYEELVKDYMAEISRLRAMLPENEQQKKSDKKQRRPGEGRGKG